MKVERLSEHPTRVRDVAEMIHGAFAHKKKDPKSLEEIIAAVSPRNDESLPITLVAIEENETIGTVTLFENDLTVREHLTPWLGSLFVKESYRNQGVGQLLIDELKQFAKTLGYSVLYLRTEEAANYYRTHNWTHIETVADNDFDHINVFTINLS